MHGTDPLASLPITYHLYFESSFSPETFAIFNISEKTCLEGAALAEKIRAYVVSIQVLHAPPCSVPHFAALRFLLTLLLTRCVQAQYDFIPQELPARIERVLMALHYGWCRSVPLPPLLFTPLLASPHASSPLVQPGDGPDHGRPDLDQSRESAPQGTTPPTTAPRFVHPTPVSHPQLPATYPYLCLVSAVQVNDALVSDIGRAIETLLDTFEVAFMASDAAKVGTLSHAQFDSPVVTPVRCTL